MLRALYSAVSGMKAHQSKLDVIGNNISNVNTYGFKASRARFQDVFYQTLTSATQSSGTQGGTNPSQIGYGSQMGGIDLDMSRSAFQATNNSMDMAIVGDGFFQVMDPDGNTYYTRAGVLSIDPSGNLIDANGNIVLGVSGDPLGQAASSNRIQLRVPNVQPTRSRGSLEANDVTFTITAENPTVDGNVSLNFMSDSSLPDGSDIMVKADEITTGAITVRVNESATFKSLEEFTQKMNQAITAGNGGPHPAGNFTITAVPGDKLFPAGGLTGEEICGSNYNVKSGNVKLDNQYKNSGIFGGMQPKSVSIDPMFAGDGAIDFSAQYHAVNGTAPANWTITAVSNGITYVGVVDSNSNVAKSVLLKATTPGHEDEYIEMSHPGFDGISAARRAESGSEDIVNNETFNPVQAGTATASTKSRDIGLTTINMELGTEGGPQTTGDCSISINANGIIEASHPNLGRWQMGRIDLVTFENPSGLEEVGNSYFSATANSGQAKATVAGTGGAGELKGSALEMSNVDISQEFSDMIVTQRGFQVNSRIINVADSILDEIVNLKR